MQQFSSGGEVRGEFDKDSEQEPSQDPKEAAPPPTWLDSYLPAKWLPYAHLMRLDKPIGISAYCLPPFVPTS